LALNSRKFKINNNILIDYLKFLKHDQIFHKVNLFIHIDYLLYKAHVNFQIKLKKYLKSIIFQYNITNNLFLQYRINFIYVTQ
jgi:hypothetical protein